MIQKWELSDYQTASCTNDKNENSGLSYFVVILLNCFNWLKKRSI